MRQYLDVSKLQQRAQKRQELSLIQKIEHFVHINNETNNANDTEAKSLQDLVEEILDQSTIGACTAHAFDYAYRIQCTDKTFKPSRLYFYFHERLAEDPNHDVKDLTDSGADVLDGLEYVMKYGVCSENLWPYDIAKFEDLPGPECDQDAQQHKIKSYKQLKESDIKHYILNNIPVLVAVQLYDSFNDIDETGIVPIPKKSEELLGGHELCVISFDNKRKLYGCVNSWGPTFGANGYVFFPYAYFQNKHLLIELAAFQV